MNRRRAILSVNVMGRAASFALIASFICVAGSPLAAQRPVPTKQQRDSIAKKSGMSGMPGMDSMPAMRDTNMAAMQPTHHMVADPLGISMERMGSGSTWIPDAVSLPSRSTMLGDWFVMMHG